MRIGHEDRRPADHRKLGDGRGAGAADDQMRLGEALAHVVEERLRPPPRRRCRRKASRVACKILRPRLLHDVASGGASRPEAARARRGSSPRKRARPGCRRRRAGGTGSSGSRRLVGPHRLDDRLADRIADMHDSPRALAALRIVEAGGEHGAEPEAGAGWRGRPRRSARARRSGFARGARRAAAARSDSRRSRRRSSGRTRFSSSREWRTPSPSVVSERGASPSGEPPENVAERDAVQLRRRHALDQLADARIGGDVHRPAAPDEHFAKRQRRKEMPAGAAGDEKRASSPSLPQALARARAAAARR